MPDEEQRLIKTAVKDIYNAPTPGDLCMDAPIKDDWSSLERLTQDRTKWKKLVHELKNKKSLTITAMSSPRTRRSVRIIQQ